MGNHTGLPGGSAPIWVSGTRDGGWTGETNGNRYWDKSYGTTATVQPGRERLQDVVSCHSDLLEASLPFVAASRCLPEHRDCLNLHPSASHNIFINISTYANAVRSYI